LADAAVATAASGFNVDAQTHDDDRDLLVRQVVSPVRWEDDAPLAWVPGVLSRAGRCAACCGASTKSADRRGVLDKPRLTAPAPVLRHYGKTVTPIGGNADRTKRCRDASLSMTARLTQSGKTPALVAELK
jgi:hypothetical protein